MLHAGHVKEMNIWHAWSLMTVEGACHACKVFNGDCMHEPFFILEHFYANWAYYVLEPYS